MKKLERNDILRFYDHYISPHSSQRRKIAIYVIPSPSAFLPEVNEKNVAIAKNIIEKWTGKKFSPMTRLQNAASAINMIAKIHQKKKKFIKPPAIVDVLIRRGLKEMEKTVPKKQIDLPKVKLLLVRFFSHSFLFG